ncbi:hypothetical protein, partial [Nonomuraea sp. KC401]|uniref:hypothetical protein n=1 Tax=Nonomuraea sp. KC401 TaxID=1848324 RepID=UPI001BB1571D
MSGPHRAAGRGFPQGWYGVADRGGGRGPGYAAASGSGSAVAESAVAEGVVPDGVVAEGAVAEGAARPGA